MKQLIPFLFVLLSGQLLFAQCYEDRHNTSWNEAWISCEIKENPNPERGESHWILYDLGHKYRLGNTHFWNINTPEMLENGFRDFFIDYSQDGNSWKSLGIHTLEQGPGLSTYEGVDLTSFGGDTARFVLFTAENNWGGMCSGFAEVKFEVVELVSKLHIYEQEECFEVSVFPNPHSTSFTISVRNYCKGSVVYSLYDHTGKQVLSGKFWHDNDLMTREINTSNLSPGLYHLIIQQRNNIARYPVMKIR